MIAGVEHVQLALDCIRTDGGTQPRAELNRDTIQDYAQSMMEGATFPPVIVFYYAFAYERDLGLDVYFIHFPKLREWFWRLPTRYPSHTMETFNRTRFEKVPIKDVRKAVPVSRYLITHNGCTFIKERSGS